MNLKFKLNVKHVSLCASRRNRNNIHACICLFNVVGDKCEIYNQISTMKVKVSLFGMLFSRKNYLTDHRITYNFVNIFLEVLEVV